MSNLDIFRFGHRAIAWRSKLQECTTALTMEEKYVAASNATKEALWLSQQACRFRQASSNLVPIVFNGSQGALALAKNPVHHNALKHIQVRYHFVRDCMTKGKLGLEKVSTINNVADGKTKSLSANRFQLIR